MNQMRLTRNYVMTNNEIFNGKRMLVVIMILLKYNLRGLLKLSMVMINIFI